MLNELFITWAPDPVLFHLGSFAVRWYSACWCIGLISVYLLEHHLYRKQGIEESKFDPLFMYCFIGILVGARLGHCLFYEPGYFLTHPIEMILPARHVDGHWVFTGYEGLASHGGTIGIILALLLYCWKTKMRFIHVLDNIAIVTPICACAIRIGNLMNSEIVGSPTTMPWGFIFANNGETFARHPGQLYEAICYALFFIVGWLCYRRMPQRVGTGFYFGLCLLLIFTARFFIEFVKKEQEAFEVGMLLNMGQMLSIPFILIGGYYVYRGLTKKVTA